jgi:DNA-binding XRE family transcriptional regulator
MVEANMERNEMIAVIDRKIKLLRAEKDFSQDKMAEILGISKKTLINIEKGRSSLGWTGAVAACVLFRDSELLEAAFGGDVMFIIQSLAFDNYSREYGRTLGGKVWWRDVRAQGGFRVQQNIISNHYRILDAEDRRICSSFDTGYIDKRLTELTASK